jgi:two-component system sensor histidine kinase VicK
MKLHSEAFDLNGLIEEVSSRMHTMRDQHVLRLELEPCIHPFWGDPDKLTQVLSNLINNALKYSPQGGEVLVSSRQEGEHIHILVQDHGIGIPHEKLEAIFEQYTRVEADVTRYISGTGLGLSIVREIVTMHGGRVWAESTLGEGASFHLLLPRAGRDTQTAEAGEQRSRATR